MNKSATSQQYVYFSPPRRRGRGKRFFTQRSQRRCGAFAFSPLRRRGRKKDFSLSGSAARFTTAQYTSNLFRKCARTLAVSCQFCYGTITTAPPEGSSALHPPFQASERPESPLLPLWEKGAGGMRGKGRGQRRAPACYPPFQASGRPNSPFSPCGRRGQRRAPACYPPFQASGRPNSPFSPCGSRGQGG